MVRRSFYLPHVILSEAKNLRLPITRREAFVAPLNLFRKAIFDVASQNDMCRGFIRVIGEIRGRIRLNHKISQIPAIEIAVPMTIARVMRSLNSTTESGTPINGASVTKSDARAAPPYSTASVHNVMPIAVE